MKLIRTLLLPVLFVAMWSLTGCNEEPITSVTPDTTPGLSKLTLPPGAVVTNATFNIYVVSPRNVDINVYKVNVPWVEATETWNTFFARPAPQWDPAVLGSFSASTTGYKSVDITSLFQGWLDGTTPNNGILLEQMVSGVITDYSAREIGATFTPYLSVTFIVGSETTTVFEPAYEDTYIWRSYPDLINGNLTTLRTARFDDINEKLTLVKFDIEATPVVNCETAYAYGQGASLQTLCFLDIPNRQGNNWGWTNQIAPGTYNWPIYAGAGLCDITKGTEVGNLNVVYTAAGTATITFQPNTGVTFGDFHVWVGTGTNLLPKTPQGKWSTAPGNYNHNGVNPVVVSGLNGNIWIAAHVGEACY